MKITAVLAMTDDLLIGKNGKLPWHIPADLKHFQEITTGGVVVMGRTTYESLPETYRPLPNRRNIVLSRGDFPEGESYSSIDELLENLEKEGIEEIFLIGGSQIYQAFLDAGLIDTVECTLIEGDYDGDAYIPEWRGDFTLEKSQGFSDGYFETYHKHSKKEQ